MQVDVVSVSSCGVKAERLPEAPSAPGAAGVVLLSLYNTVDGTKKWTSRKKQEPRAGSK